MKITELLNEEQTPTKLTRSLKIEVRKFFDEYPSNIDDDDIGKLYHEEFSDRYTDTEVDAQVLDADMSRVVKWHNTLRWPAANWKW